MHEENFLSSWLHEVGQDKKERWRLTGGLRKKRKKRTKLGLLKEVCKFGLD